MTARYPYGKAPLAILIIALTAGAIVSMLQLQRKVEKPDLTFAIFAKNHENAYRAVIGEFERANNVRVQMQLVDSRALQSRLQSALLTDAEVPDLVELLEGSIGYFTRGPLSDVGFVDITDRLHKEGLYDKMVESRYGLWSSRGHIFALPHDVHPVALCYRRDLIEKSGIEVKSIETWDDFVRIGRELTRDLDGDGIIDQYAIDFPVDDINVILILAAQRGAGMFNSSGALTMDSELMLDTLLWYVRQTCGKNRISYGAGWGQSLAKAMGDGLVLFYFCPDWRTRQFEMDVPYLSGKLALMPLPAWEKGGCRTSTWGGTGLAITKRCKKQELAWKFAKFLYLEKEKLGERFKSTNIIPPLKEAWNLPEFNETSAYFSGQSIGKLYSGLAIQTPARNISPYSSIAASKLLETYLDAASYFKLNGEDGLREHVRARLSRNSEYVKTVIKRNVFLSTVEDEKKGN